MPETGTGGLLPAEPGESRLSWLKMLRKGQGILREEAPDGLPYGLFDVEDWEEFKRLVRDSLRVCGESDATYAVRYALNCDVESLPDNLTDRREAAARYLKVSTRTVQRLEEQGLSDLNDWMWKLRDPSAIFHEFDRALHVLEQISESKKIFKPAKSKLDEALDILRQVVIPEIITKPLTDEESEAVRRALSKP